MKHGFTGTLDHGEKAFLCGVLTVLHEQGRIEFTDKENLTYEANDEEAAYVRLLIQFNFQPINSDFEIT